MPDTNEIISDFRIILSDFNGREYSGPVEHDTLFMQDIGFSSIDVVILGETLETYYKSDISFGDFINEMSRQNVQDVPVGALAEYLAKTL